MLGRAFFQTLLGRHDFKNAGTLSAVILGLALLPLEGRAQAQASRTPPVSRSPQLAVQSFAGCLAGEAPNLRWHALADHHQLSTHDGFLTFLAVYPNRRVPFFERIKQEPAHRRWQVAFEPAEERLMSAVYLASERTLYPATLFREALQACRASGIAVVHDDLLCASVILHNALRTMGRSAQAILDEDQNFNPHWYRANPAFWDQVFPLVRRALIPLRPDGRGDRFGEWYHFFGILAFATHESALRGTSNPHDAPENTDLWLAELAARANRVLNPVLAGGREEPEKARLDLDSLEVAKTWFFRAQTPPASCESAEAYVARLTPSG